MLVSSIIMSSGNIFSASLAKLQIAIYHEWIVCPCRTLLIFIQVIKDRTHYTRMHSLRCQINASKVIRFQVFSLLPSCWWGQDAVMFVKFHLLTLGPFPKKEQIDMCEILQHPDTDKTRVVWT